MTGMLGVLSVGLGTMIGLLIIGTLLVLFVKDITQKKHTVLRNYPVIGRMRYFLEEMGERSEEHTSELQSH